MIKPFLIFLFLGITLSPAQEVILENEKLKMVIDLNGGSTTGFQLKSSEINPLHTTYGHFLAFDRWGQSSQEDQNKGILNHGEAKYQTWNLSAL